MRALDLTVVMCLVVCVVAPAMGHRNVLQDTPAAADPTAATTDPATAAATGTATANDPATAAATDTATATATPAEPAAIEAPMDIAAAVEPSAAPFAVGPRVPGPLHLDPAQQGKGPGGYYRCVQQL